MNPSQTAIDVFIYATAFAICGVTFAGIALGILIIRDIWRGE